jgi:predicted RNase H-like nuclease
MDIPIGLPDNSDIRECDLGAHRALGEKRSSVFLTPPRSRLEAIDPLEFQRMHREIRAKGAGLPVWGISGNVVRIDNVVFQKLCQIIFLGYPDMYELPRSIEGWSWFFPAYGSLLMLILGPIFVF